MKEKLVIDGNAVYKMDPDCLLKKEQERKRKENDHGKVRKEKTDSQNQRGR